MPLPINISDLLNGHTVEWERLEFKTGWNPEAVLHTVCAFANDINNWGGGYIVIGVEEKEGLPVLPPVGLKQNQLDSIQKKLIEISHKIAPFYSPVTSPVVVNEKHLLIIWVPGGENRPYKAPASLAEKSHKRFFIRRGSKTVPANTIEEITLIGLAAKIPFDDRINHQAGLSDLKLLLIQNYLQEIGSELYEHSSKLSFEELTAKMQIARGSLEYFKPLNVGLLFFNEHPETYFRGAIIEVVVYKDENGTSFIEKKFSGPLHYQLRGALSYIKSNIIEEYVQKIEGKAEALRFFNYPYRAIEESLTNAVYHKDYENRATIEVNIRFDRIEILSFPGPLPPIDNAALKQKNIVARDYRNRRIGDFLKELHLSEGRGTGIPSIYMAMQNNQSPDPLFETDEEKTYFLTTLMINKQSLEILRKRNQEDVPLNVPLNVPLSKRRKLVLDLVIADRFITVEELANKSFVSEKTIKRDLDYLKNNNILKRTGSRKTGFWEIIQ